jgi:hypothetical protein
MAVAAALLALRVMEVMLEGPGIRETQETTVQAVAAAVAVAVLGVTIQQTPQPQATPQ